MDFEVHDREIYSETYDVWEIEKTFPADQGAMAKELVDAMNKCYPERRRLVTRVFRNSRHISSQIYPKPRR
jgi:hypothetical protein